MNELLASLWALWANHAALPSHSQFIHKFQNSILTFFSANIELLGQIKLLIKTTQYNSHLPPLSVNSNFLYQIVSKGILPIIAKSFKCILPQSYSSLTEVTKNSKNKIFSSKVITVDQ